MIAKKQLLKDKLKNNEIKKFTILGIPSERMQKEYFSSKNWMSFFKKENIYSNDCSEADGISIYFPNEAKKRHINVCSIHVTTNISEEVFENIISLFDEVLGHYPLYVSPKKINSILGLYQDDDENLDFEDMISLMGISKNQLATLIRKTPSTISDIARGRQHLTMYSLGILMREYPLLPWDVYIKNSTKSKR